MTNESMVSPEDLQTIVRTVGELKVNKDFACDTDELMRIFGVATLDRVLILELHSVRNGTLIRWA